MSWYVSFLYYNANEWVTGAKTEVWDVSFYFLPVRESQRVTQWLTVFQNLHALFVSTSNITSGKNIFDPIFPQNQRIEIRVRVRAHYKWSVRSDRLCFKSDGETGRCNHSQRRWPASEGVKQQVALLKSNSKAITSHTQTCTLSSTSTDVQWRKENSTQCQTVIKWNIIRNTVNTI